MGLTKTTQKPAHGIAQNADSWHSIGQLKTVAIDRFCLVTRVLFCKFGALFLQENVGGFLCLM